MPPSRAIVQMPRTPPRLETNATSEPSGDQDGRSSIYRLTKISRREPAADLFKVPAGYTIVDIPPKGSDIRKDDSRASDQI